MKYILGLLLLTGCTNEFHPMKPEVGKCYLDANYNIYQVKKLGQYGYWSKSCEACLGTVFHPYSSLGLDRPADCWEDAP